MRYTYEGFTRAKAALLLRLSVVVGRMCVGTTQKELAEELDIPRATVSRIKNCDGKNISFERLLNIAEKLGIDYQLSFISKGKQQSYEFTIDNKLFRDVFKNNTIKGKLPKGVSLNI